MPHAPFLSALAKININVAGSTGHVARARRTKCNSAYDPIAFADLKGSWLVTPLIENAPQESQGEIQRKSATAILRENVCSGSLASPYA
jgi:hypothetical protein